MADTQEIKKTAKPSGYRKLEVLLAILLFASVLVLVMFSPMFNIKEIQVFGTSYYSAEGIIATSGIETGINGFKNVGGSIDRFLTLRYGDIEQAIKDKLPYVKDVAVKFVIPDILRIYITERTPACVVKYLDVLLLVDEEGYVLESLKNITDYNFPKISGLDLTGFCVGQKLYMQKPAQFENIMKLIDLLKETDTEEFSLANKISSYEVNGQGELRILYDSRILVNLGKMVKMDYKISMLREILMKNIGADETGLLDFSIGNNPVFTPEKTGGIIK
mgnify:FL=1